MNTDKEDSLRYAIHANEIAKQKYIKEWNRKELMRQSFMSKLIWMCFAVNLIIFAMPTESLVFAVEPLIWILLWAGLCYVDLDHDVRVLAQLNTPPVKVGLMYMQYLLGILAFLVTCYNLFVV